MIARLWRGRTDPARADAYEQFLRNTAYPDYGGVPGNRGWHLLRQDAADHVEFLFISFWDDLDAVRRYAGDEIAAPKYYPEDLAALLELPERAQHYAVIDAQSG